MTRSSASQTLYGLYKETDVMVPMRVETMLIEHNPGQHAPRPRPKWKFIAGLALLCAVLGACAQKAEEKSTPSTRDQKTIRVRAALLNEVWTPPPWSHRNDGHWPQWWFIYDRLIENNERHEAEFPNLARDWDAAADGRRYTFYLRDDVRWHDGKPFTARDVEATFLFILDGYLTNSPHFSQFLTLEGLEEYRAGKAKNIAGIQVDDDHTIHFNLEKPVAFFLSNMGRVSMLPRHQLEVVGESSKVEGHRLWRDPGAIGTGPFRLVETVPFQFVRLQAYEDYHLGRPGIDAVIIHAKEAALAAGSGELDLGDATPSAAEEIARMAHMEILARPGINRTSLTVNVAAPALRDVRVRRALLHAIDRKTIAESLFGAYGEVKVPNGVMPDYGWQHPDLPPVDYDPQRARTLLRAAGWDPRTSLKLLIRDIDMAGIRLDVATIVQGYWKEVGVETEIEPVEAAIIVERMVKGEYDFYVGGAAALLPFDLLRFHSGSPSPVAFGYSNPKVDELVAQIGDTYDHEQLRPLYYQLQQYLWEDVATMPIVNPTVLVAKSRRLRIGPLTINNNLPIGTWWHQWEIVE